MFELSRLLRSAGNVSWQSNRKQGRRPLRREALKVEELEERIVPTLLGQQLYPSDYPWNQNISNAPVAANSAAIINHIGPSINIHPNWGADNPANGSSPLYGTPFNVVHGNSTGTVNVTIDNYPGESDIVPVPIPQNAVLEGDYQNGPNPNGGGYNPGQRGDSHLIVWDEDNNIAYELFGVTRPSDPTLFPNTSGVELPHTDGLWHAAQETVWNMNTDNFRTLGETSANAAGVSLLAGLARPDEGLTVAQGGQAVINHALSVTLPAGDINPQYIYPASHMVHESQGANNLPLGARLRLANTPAIDTLISNMPPESQIIATAMQQYGLMVTDIGSPMFVSGASASVDANNNISLTWDLNDIFASNGLKALNAGDFQVINLTPIVTGLSASSGTAGSTITVNGQNFSGAAGHISVFFGNTAASSVTVLSDTQLSVVVPSGSGTVDVTVQSGVNETDNISSNPNANVNAPIFGYGTSATTPADQFTFTQAMATPTFANLSAPTIVYGTPTTTISGQLQSNSPQPVPAGETVQVTLNNVTQNATLDGNDNFSTTFNTSTLGVSGSPYTVSFSYGGDANFQSASASSTLTVNPDGTTTKATVSGSQDFGQAQTFTATVTANSPGSATPIGSVDFFDSTTNYDLGSVTLSSGSGSLTTTALPDGAQTITMTYSGNGNFQGSNSSVNVNLVRSVYALDPKASGAVNISGSAVLNVPGILDVDSNSTTALLANNNAQITAASIGVVGGSSIKGKATVSPKPTKIASFSDPLASLPAPTGGTKQSSVNLTSGSLTINPGIYSKISVSGTGQLTLNPGLYILAGGGLSVSGGSVSGSGVTIFNMGSNYPNSGGFFGYITLTNNATVNLTAPTTGTYAGIAVFQARASTRGITLGNSAVLNLNGGILYAPAALLSETGSAQLQHGSLVVDELVCNGTTSITAPARRGNPPVPQAGSHGAPATGSANSLGVRGPLGAATSPQDASLLVKGQTASASHQAVAGPVADNSGTDALMFADAQQMQNASLYNTLLYTTPGHKAQIQGDTWNS
jgi:hypothetical protein